MGGLRARAARDRLFPAAPAPAPPSTGLLLLHATCIMLTSECFLGSDNPWLPWTHLFHGEIGFAEVEQLFVEDRHLRYSLY